MSHFGMQLPTEVRIQKKLGPDQKNMGGASLYSSPLHKRSQSFQWNTYHKPRPDLYSKIQGGKGTVFSNQFVNTSNCFEFTMRNTQHDFHSNGFRQQSFNNQKYNHLVKHSRFQNSDVVDEILSPESPIQKKGYRSVAGEIEYDIKGNSYKNTLLPEKSAKSAFSRHRENNSTPYGQSYTDVHKPVKPRYKGYVRSGQILFNNINQVNTWDYKTPKASSGAKTALGTPSKLFVETKQQEQGSKSTERLHQLKQKEHMASTMSQLINYSPEYKLNKLNFYDNTVRNASRQLYETCDFSRDMPKEGTRPAPAPPEQRVNLGSFMGPGARAVMYGSWAKRQHKPSTSIDSTRLNLSNKPLISELRAQKHYDSNIKNEISYQQNLLEQKANELDMRSQGVSRYGYQPYYKKDLENKRKIEGILFDQVQGREPENRLPAYKRKFTPITTYMKKLHDSRITHLYGNKMKA